MDTQLQELLIRAKKDVFGGNIGETLTTFKGDGLDFREIKEYEFGDNVKTINWKVTAKTGITKVNVFNVERELNIVIAFLVSGSIHFGTFRFKQEVMSEIVALLGYSTIKNHNKLTSLFFSNQEEAFFPPSKNQATIYQMTKEAFALDALHKEIDYQKFCDYVNATIKEKSLIFIVGDFYGEDIDLSSIAYKNEVYALIVRDRFEEYPIINGEYNFISPVNFASTEINMDKKIAKKLQQLIKKQDDKLYEHFQTHKIVSGKIYTDEDIYLRLTQILKG
ncbi:hypothetical protein MNB_SM-3-723 [hydrothermal vent metagenome]|uniref:DUF58 domain-containing protein n=1 Tax=hydrothermal vent metagenome TaxID=652676 RepID=A0A1W1D3S0_9ZZZZ